MQEPQPREGEESLQYEAETDTPLTSQAKQATVTPVLRHKSFEKGNGCRTQHSMWSLRPNTSM